MSSYNMFQMTTAKQIDMIGHMDGGKFLYEHECIYEKSKMDYRKLSFMP